MAPPGGGGGPKRVERVPDPTARALTPPSVSSCGAVVLLSCSSRLWFWKHVPLPYLLCKVGWVTPLHRRGSAFGIASPGGKALPRWLRKPTLGRGQDSVVNSATLPGDEAWGRVASSGQWQFLGLGGTLTGPATAAATPPPPPGHREVGHGPVGEQHQQAPPHHCGLGVAAGTGAAEVSWKLGKHKLSSASTTVTAALAHGPTQPGDSKHLSLSGLRGPSWLSAPGLGVLIQVEKSSERSFCNCPCPAQGGAGTQAAHQRSPQSGLGKTTPSRFCVGVVVSA